MKVRKSLFFVCLGAWLLMSAGCGPSKEWGGILRGGADEKVARDDYRKKLEQKLSRVEREKDKEMERQAAAAQAEQRQDRPVSSQGVPTGQSAESSLPAETRAPAAETDQQKEQAMAAKWSEPYRVDSQYVDDRLQTYEQKMERWNNLAGSLVSLGMGGVWPEGWHDCVQQVEMIIFGYRRLREEEWVGGANSGPWELFKKDVDYFESGCDQVFGKSNVEFRETLGEYSALSYGQAKKLIQQYLDKGMYAASVEAYRNFVRLHGADQVGPGIKGMYSLALRRIGRLAEAAAVLKEIVARGMVNGLKDPDLLDRSIDYADLLLATGNLEEASTVYGRLEDYLLDFESKRDWVSGQLHLLERKDSRVLPDYQEFLRASIRADGRQVPKDMVKGIEKIERSGESVFFTSASILLHRAENLAEEWVAGQLSLVDELLHDQEYDKAAAIVEQLFDGAPESLKSTLFRMKDEIEFAAQRESETQRQLTEQARAAQWDKAVKFLELKDYDAAMAIFAKLLGTEYDTEARRKLAEIANLAAADMRRRAAGLFVKARKTQNNEDKKEILFESRDILMELIERYPTVDIRDKVRLNLQVLEREIKKLEREPHTEPTELGGAANANGEG